MKGSHTSRALVLDVLSPVALILIAAFSSFRQEDVRFWDESLYLERGSSLAFGARPSWEWNPLYTDMYWLLGRLFTSPIDLYFAGRALSAITVVLAVWISLRLFTHRGIAAAGALVMSALPITYVWPGVSSPSAGFLLVAIAIAWRWRNPSSYVTATAITWLAAAVRPEFVWAALGVTVTVAVVLVLSVTRKHITVTTVTSLGFGLVAMPLILTVAYGNPIDLGTRSWEAFEQHYELRFATESDDPWQIDADVIGRDFPGASSIPAAATANTPAFVTHVGKNVLALPISTGGHFMGFGGDSRSQNLIGVATAGLWLTALTLALVRSPARTRAFTQRSWRTLVAPQSRGAMVIAVIVVGAALVSTVVIYPRPHYLVLAVAILVMMTGIVIADLANPRVTPWLPVTAIMATSALALTAHFFSPMGSANKLNAESLRALNALPDTWILLTPERPIDIYLVDGQQIINPSEETLAQAETFSDLVESSGVNVIFDGILFRQAEYAQLPGFDAFLQDPTILGFEPVIPGSPFLVRR